MPPLELDRRPPVVVSKAAFVGDVGDPDLVGLRGDDRRLRAEDLQSPALAALRAQSFGTNQACNPVMAAALAELAHVIVDLAIPVHAAALQPGLLDATQQTLILDGTGAATLAAPCAVAAGV